MAKADRPIDWSCPTCGAVSGELCFDSEGGYLGVAHKERGRFWSGSERTPRKRPKKKKRTDVQVPMFGQEGE